MQKFGDAFLASMLGDNIHEFINLMDDRGELVFSDRQAHRMERAMANMEFGFGEGGYQPSEFIKRQLPQGTFDLLIADEAHEYKNGRLRPGPGHGGVGGQGAQDAAAHRHTDGRLRRRPVPPAVPSPAWADDRRRLQADEERQHDVGRDGVHARSRRAQGHLFREHGHGAQDRQGHQGIGAHGQGAGLRSRRACCVASCRSRSSSS
jgi:hypothetical protein